MTHRLFVTIRGGTEQEAVSLNVAYGAAQGLGLMADALAEIGVTAAIYPEPESAEANFMMPRQAPTARLVLCAIGALAAERGDDALEARAEQGLSDLKMLEAQGLVRANPTERSSVVAADSKSRASARRPTSWRP